MANGPKNTFMHDDDALDETELSKAVGGFGVGAQPKAALHDADHQVANSIEHTIATHEPGFHMPTEGWPHHTSSPTSPVHGSSPIHGTAVVEPVYGTITHLPPGGLGHGPEVLPGHSGGIGHVPVFEGGHPGGISHIPVFEGGHPSGISHIPVFEPGHPGGINHFPVSGPGHPGLVNHVPIHDTSVMEPRHPGGLGSIHGEPGHTITGNPSLSHPIGIGIAEPHLNTPPAHGTTPHTPSQSETEARHMHDEQKHGSLAGKIEGALHDVEHRIGEVLHKTVSSELHEEHKLNNAETKAEHRAEELLHKQESKEHTLEQKLHNAETKAEHRAEELLHKQEGKEHALEHRGESELNKLGAESALHKAESVVSDAAQKVEDSLKKFF